MAFLGTPSTGGASGFLSAPSEDQKRARKIASLQAEATKSKAAAKDANSIGTLAKETILGIPKVLQGGAKAVIDPAAGAIATPVLRVVQAGAAVTGRATGNARLEEEANKELPLPSIFGGEPIPVAPQRGFDEGGAQQIAGDTLKYAATVYPGSSVEKAAGQAFLGKVGKSAAEAATGGAIAGGAYGTGDALARKGATPGDIAKEGLTGAGVGAVLGGVLGAGGAKLAQPGAIEREATRMRPLPVTEENPTFYRGNYGRDLPKDNRNMRPDSTFGRSMFFADNPETAGLYSSAVKEANLDIKKPFVIMERTPDDPGRYRTVQNFGGPEKFRQMLKDEGYDGIIVDNGGKKNKEVIALDAKQISAPPQPNVRRKYELPVEGQSRAKNVPLNRIYPKESELPVIQMGAKGKGSLPTIEAGKPTSNRMGDMTVEPIATKAPAAPKLASARQVAPKVIPVRTVEPTRPPAALKRQNVPELRPNEPVTVSKAAKDVNRKLAEEGVEGLPEDQLARITSITKENQIAKVSKLLEDVEASNRAAVTGEGIPSDVAPQVLYNAVKKRARDTADYALQRELARSPLAAERAAAAQTLGSAGFNNGPADAVDAIAEVSKARQKAAKRRKLPSEVDPEIAAARKAVKAASSKDTWNSIVDSLTC